MFSTKQDTTGAQYINSEGQKATYRIGASFAPIASATAPSFSITGSASKTIRITRIRLSATAATGGAADISLFRFSALSGGTSASQTAGKLDTTDAAATAVVNTWSVAATTATKAGGTLCAERYEIVTAAVTVLPQVVEWDFGEVPGGRSLVLRGTSDFVGILFSAIGTTPASDIWVEWTEE